MTDEDVRYQVQSEQVLRGRESSTLAQRQSDGWDLVSQQTSILRTEMTFRRPRPPEPKTLGTYAMAAATWAYAAFRRLEPRTQVRLGGGVGGLVVVLIIGLVIAVASQGGDETSDSTSAPTKVAVTPSASPTLEPSDEPSEVPTQPPSEEPTQIPATPEPQPSAGKVTNGEVVSAFRTYLAQRAKSGVKLAKAVSDVRFGDRVLRVTFDPGLVGLDNEGFDGINIYNNPYDASDNLADLVSTPIAFNTDVGVRLRPPIDRIEAVRADGKVLGVRTTAEIIKLNELDR